MPVDGETVVETVAVPATLEDRVQYLEAVLQAVILTLPGDIREELRNAHLI